MVPYDSKKTKIGEHMYGVMIYIGNVPYHFEKYIPTKEELINFKKEDEGDPQLSKGGFFYRLVPYTR